MAEAGQKAKMGRVDGVPPESVGKSQQAGGHSCYSDGFTGKQLPGLCTVAQMLAFGSVAACCRTFETGTHQTFNHEEVARGGFVPEASARRCLEDA